LANHYRLPTPLLVLRSALRDHAKAAADVSDGLLADAGHIARASGLGVTIDLDRLPLSAGAAAWLERQADRASALTDLAAGGDDYALACAVDPSSEAAFVQAVAACGIPVAVLGRFRAEPGLTVRAAGAPIQAHRLGWRH
jgi:thiamine-monophosphate kinase